MAQHHAESGKLHLLCELVDLAVILRQEKLFVSSEQAELHRLNREVNGSWYTLAQLVWINWQQRICIKKMAISHGDMSPSVCCNNVSALDCTKFIEAHKVLNYPVSIRVTQLLNFLRNRPQLLAKCLSIGDQLQCAEKTGCTSIVDSVVISSLYGSCLLPDNKVLTLKLLLHLAHLQLVASEDPLSLLRQGSCAFVRLYFLFHEGLYSATLFLTAALHEPIMDVLMDDDKFLDIDSEKALIRFSPLERQSLFGPDDSTEYAERLARYRQWNVQKLVFIANKFIDSIRKNLHCFPSSVCWLMKHVYNSLVNNRGFHQPEIFAMCVDLIFTSLICPAIVHPEFYGIVTAPISYIARSNLMQIAKILQMLAARKYEKVDPITVQDLYQHFDQDCLTPIMDMLLEDILERNEFEQEPNFTYDNGQLKQLCNFGFFTQKQLEELISFLHSVANSEGLCSDDKAQLKDLLSSLPDNIFFCHQYPKTADVSVPPSLKSSIISKVNKTKISASAMASSVLGGTNSVNASLKGQECGKGGEKSSETVLIFTFNDEEDRNIGLLTEQEFVEGKTCLLVTTEPVVFANSNDKNDLLPERKTIDSCYSLTNSRDGEGSNRSQDSSSLDLEEAEDTCNDNLSDMISANVSGRGSPNISGRDTPSSQVIELNEEAEAQPPPVTVPKICGHKKQPRFDLDDKFGKFEINSMGRKEKEETVSLVSDTWSTEVLASDSEMPEQGGNAQVATIADACSCPSTRGENLSNFYQLAEDTSETASEGWSTDVVASDSDRITEVDTDDTASITRSDIIAEMEMKGDILIRRDESREKNHAFAGTFEMAMGSKEIVSSSGFCSENNTCINVRSLKSISFDKTADRGDRDEDCNKKGFFKNFKNAFKSRRGRSDNTNWIESDISALTVTFDNRATFEDQAAKIKLPLHFPVAAVDCSNEKDAAIRQETSEDILAKYRVKGGDVQNENLRARDVERHEIVNKEETTVRPFCALENAKNKLRIVLSIAEFQRLPNVNENFQLRRAWCQHENMLTAFLQMQLAEAINMNDRSLIALLRETIRCLHDFNNDQCRCLFESLKTDSQNRSSYMTYLINCRQSLLSIVSHLSRLNERVKCEQSVCKNFLASTCVRSFLQKREEILVKFALDFHTLKVADEKNQLLSHFLATLYTQIKSDQIWLNVDVSYMELIEAAIENVVLSRVYIYAMFPNGDVDISRDEVLHQHLKKLSRELTLSHKDLTIPKKYHNECPWPSAQAELSAISAYKTPRDKLDCVLRCAQTIQNLLFHACNNSAPSADDMVPVLVFVLIMHQNTILMIPHTWYGATMMGVTKAYFLQKFSSKSILKFRQSANPPNLLSTVQYINNFYNTRLQGEENYWWVQFCSAIEFVKTMDYYATSS